MSFILLSLAMIFITRLFSTSAFLVPTLYNQSETSDLSLNDVRVKFAEHVKYLGILRHASLKDDNDMQRPV